MDHPHPLADPVADRAVELKLQEFAAAHPPQALAGSEDLCAELARYEIAVLTRAVYDWRGYRYTNATDAIAAAKRGRK